MEDVRCHCGKLLCKVEGDYVFVKCRHCKRVVRIKVVRKAIIMADLDEENLQKRRIIHG